MTELSWAVLERDAPDLAAAALRLMLDQAAADAPLLGYLATVRRDGAPRLHPVCPVAGHGGLFVFVPTTSPKRFDLAEDGRFALHAPLGPDDEELVLLGVARRVTEAARRAQAEAAARHATHASDWCFELLIARCLWGVWTDAGQPGTRATRRAWEAGEEGG